MGALQIRQKKEWQWGQLKVFLEGVRSRLSQGTRRVHCGHERVVGVGGFSGVVSGGEGVGGEPRNQLRRVWKSMV